MPITNHYSFCISEILHLFSSQLIIDFPFVHSKFVNDFMRTAFFSFLFPHRPAPSYRTAFLRNLKTFETQNVFTYPQKRDPATFSKHLQSQDELIKDQYVACIIIYQDQHLGKY